MSILINKETKVICQGFTGAHGTFHSEQALSMVQVGWWCHSKRWSKTPWALLFNKVAEAKEKKMLMQQ